MSARGRRHCFAIFASDGEVRIEEGDTARSALGRAFLSGGFRSALAIIRLDLVRPAPAFPRTAGPFTAYLGKPAHPEETE